jgi:gliding motility-associated-like protein
VFITPTLTLNSGAICLGDSYTLNASGASTYTYSSGSPVVSPVVNTTYSVNGTSADGCLNVSPAIANVTVHPLPVVTASASQTLICAGSTITLNGGGANTYTWSNGVLNAGAFSPSASAAYTVTGTDLNNCENNASISVSVNPLPLITVQSANALTCDGETTTLSVSGANTFTWSTGAQTPSISVTLSVSTTFTVSGTAPNSCVNTVTYTQLVDPCAGVVQINTKLKDVTCKNRKDGEIELTPNVSYPAYKAYYFWAQSELCADSTCSSLKKLSAGTYPVRVRIEYTLTSTFSKIDTLDLNITLVDLNPPCPLTVYNGLTLNNDKVNDIFYIENIHSYTNNKVSIFNRWGEELFSIQGYDNETKVWPDEKEADKLVSGTYYYIIDPGDGSEPEKGWIEVLKN